MTDENSEQNNPINEVELMEEATTNRTFPGFERLVMTTSPGRSISTSTSTSIGGAGETTAYGTNYLLIPPRFFEFVVLHENFVTVRVVSYFLLEALVAPDPVKAEIEVSAEELAETLSMSKLSVRNGITRAMTMGYIRQTFDGSNSRTRPSRYSVVWADEFEPMGTNANASTAETDAGAAPETTKIPPESRPSLLSNLASFRQTVVRPVTRWQLSYQFATPQGFLIRNESRLVSQSETERRKRLCQTN